MAEQKTVYCPRYHRAVTKWDGKSTINPLARRTGCRKLVIYRIDTEVTEVLVEPTRKQNSGLTFY